MEYGTVENLVRLRCIAELTEPSFLQDVKEGSDHDVDAMSAIIF